ncbi:MAG: shikimate dehydrogenase family protein [Verrucomicrobiota bacterium]
MSPDDALDAAAIAGLRPEGPRLGVLGDPIAHSRSPQMHAAAIAALASASPEVEKLRYLRLHVKAEELPEALRALHAAGFIGLNLTVPHKVAALGLAESLSPEARRAGSVNTLVRTEQGWSGRTTDGRGFLEALKERSGRGVQGRPVIILGAGGAARAVAAACLDGGCSSLLVASRDAAKAAAVTGQLGGGARSSGLTASLRPPKDAVIVNCTTLGLKPDDPSPLHRDALLAGQFVFDTTYGRTDSRLLRDARAAGAQGCDGRPMLRWQGALAFREWTGILPPAVPMRDAIGERT